MKKQATKKTYSEDYVGAMLEEIRSDFKVFGEGLDDVRRGLNDLREDVHEIKEDLSIVKIDLNEFKAETRENFKTLFEFRDETAANFKKVFEFKAETKDNFSTTMDYLSRIDDEITDIRAELEKGKKAGKMEESWFKKIEQRVLIVERQLKGQKSLVIK